MDEDVFTCVIVWCWIKCEEELISGRVAKHRGSKLDRRQRI